MNPCPARKVNVLDLIVLIAATAVSLAAIRYLCHDTVELTPYLRQARHALLYPHRSGHNPGRVGHDWLAFACGVVARFAFVWFRSPRAGLLAMIQRPGVSAATVATIVVMAFLGWYLGGRWPMVEVPGMGSDGQMVIGSIGLFPTSVLDELRWKVGPAVAATWVVLAASGRWRLSADWIDRSGLALSLGWLLLYIESLR